MKSYPDFLATSAGSACNAPFPDGHGESDFDQNGGIRRPKPLFCPVIHMHLHNASAFFDLQRSASIRMGSKVRKPFLPAQWLPDEESSRAKNSADRVAA
jgi:hypothetical protein